jgi:hypothetical protein
MTGRDDIWNDYGVREQTERAAFGGLPEMREPVDSSKNRSQEVSRLSESGMEQAQNPPS